MARLMLLIWSLRYLLFMYFSATTTLSIDVKRNFKLGILVPFNGGKACSNPGPFHGHMYSPAILVAVDEIERTSNWNFNLTWVWNDTKCDESLALKQQFWQLNNGVDAFIGPALSCATSSMNAVAFNKPVMSYNCKDSLLRNKDVYKTIARTSLSDFHLTLPLMATLKHFEWERVAIIYEKDVQWTMIYDYVSKYLKAEENNITVAHEDSIHFPYTSLKDLKNETIIESVKKLRTKARIIILLLSPRVFIEYMRYAYDEGLVQTGEYVFIGFQLKQISDERPGLWYFSQHSSSNNEKVMKSFGAALIIRARPIMNETDGHKFPRVYEKFSTKIRQYSRQAPFQSDGYSGCLWDNVKSGCSLNSTQEGCKCLHNRTNNHVPLEGANLYHAIMQYAYALNTTLANGSEPNGVNIVDALKGHTFDSIFGFSLTFDDKADVLFNMTLVHQEYVNGTKENTNCDPFNNDFPCMVMKTYAEFWINNKNLKEQEFRIKDKNKSKTWFGGRTDIPLDVPVCGFENELCPDKPKSDNLKTIIGSVSGVLAVLLLLLLYNIYRQYAMEKQLHSLLWKIDFAEISVEDRRRSQISIESMVIGSLMQDSNSSSSEQGRHRDYELTDTLLGSHDDDLATTSTQLQKCTVVGFFKGNYVAVKKLSKKSVDLTRTVLKELNLMREVRHDNLNQFIGACVEPGNILIVTHFCQKGSLMDILVNEDVHLDHTFILSLLYDITKGMTFLHSTDIKVHGNLKSTNCLVDSRWQLKITDYGLPTFKSKQIKPYSCEHDKYRNMLWKAPELLRSSDANDVGTHASDVYSFAIILQEFHTRKGPYSANYDELRDIIEHVKAIEFPPYRPVIPDLIEKLEELRGMAKECWSELPQERPTFADLKKRIHRLLVDLKMKTNILDNMIYMMEKYTDNLEDLVVERTGQLSEEKKKTDALLERMLPSSVAEQLKKGKAVEAESFQCVTIYFSDIVSFTELCAESTPLQVVTLLNDLYTLFDDIIREFDVYKVETIGDAYMVVSGLPKRNGNLHASEISCMAIRIRDSVLDFKIRHKPNLKLKLRIGIHSGPVVAGVVGRTMPRYCLFGDTVNTASRLESTGEALSIHISDTTNEILEKLGGFQTEKRGEISVKGKGSLVTYWLLGANSDVPRSPHREMIPPDLQLAPRPTGQAGLLLREFHQSNLSLRGSMRGSFRNSPAIMRNGGGHVARESPVMVRWKKADDELLMNGVHS